MNKLQLLFMTSRPISWVNTAYPFAATYLMMGGNIDVRWAIGTLFFLVPYNLMMYGINDVYDYESDMRNPRKGGVEGAITPKHMHTFILWSSVLAVLPFIIVLTALGSFLSALTLIAVMFFVVAYSVKGLRFKEIPFVDSITSSIHFVGPMVYALTLVGVSQKAVLAATAFFVWGIASQAFGAVQDILPDRQAKINSIATVLGAKLTTWLALSMYCLAVVLVAILGGIAWIVAAAGVLYSINVLPYVAIDDRNSGLTRAGWKRFMVINYVVGAVVTICCILAVM